MGEKIAVIVPALIKEPRHLQMTLDCIKSAREKTKLPFELVIVETVTEYLKSYADVYIWEREKTNSTISIDRGFQCARADKVVLLTNDVVVDENWLEHLLECFEIPDCGLSTLATTQFHMQKRDLIAEGIWFSVAMIPKDEAWFDPHFLGGSWDDTDLIMRTYLRGKRMYRNWRSVVSHAPGQTHYSNPAHQETFEKNRAYFFEKWRGYKSMPIYQVFHQGLVI